MRELKLNIHEHNEVSVQELKISGGYTPPKRKVNNFNQWYNGYVPAKLKSMRYDNR